MSSRIYNCLSAIADVIEENKDFLTELDREIGDADHGVNMARGFHAVTEKLPQDSDDIGAALKKTGMTLLSKVGGASGPLYGTAYMEAAKIAAGKNEITAEEFGEMLAAAIAGIQKRGKAVRGEQRLCLYDPSSLLESRRNFWGLTALKAGGTFGFICFRSRWNLIELSA